MKPPRWHIVHSTSSDFFLPRSAFTGSGLKAVGRQLLRGEERGEVEHVLAREVFQERVHLRLLAPAFLEVPAAAGRRSARVWPGEDRELRLRRVAVGAVAGDAGLGLLAPGLDVLRVRGGREQRGQRDEGSTLSCTERTWSSIQKRGRPRGGLESACRWAVRAARTRTPLLPRLKSSWVLPPQPIATYCFLPTM